jgi:hypothetical protein
MKIKHYCPMFGEVEIDISDDTIQKAVEAKIDSKILSAKLELKEQISNAAKARVIPEQ